MLLSKWIKWMRMLNIIIMLHSFAALSLSLSASHVHSAASFMNGRSIKKTLLYDTRSFVRCVVWRACMFKLQKMILNQTCCCSNTLQTVTVTTTFFLFTNKNSWKKLFFCKEQNFCRFKWKKVVAAWIESWAHAN